jgi:epoxide hydrolase-like predicted phosphatase
MIKAVIFDYFGVVCSNEFWHQIKHDKRVAADFGKMASDVNEGKMHWHEFVSELAKRTEKSIDEMEKLYETEQLQPDVLSYASDLHLQCKTALLTNGHHEFIDPIIKAAGLDKVFDYIIISSELGIPKPNPEIFAYALGKLDVKPNEAIFIDDGELNVEGAKSIGIQTILYKDTRQMIRDVSKLLKA